MGAGYSRVWLAGWVSFLATFGVQAQDKPHLESKAQRVLAPPVIDGELDDAAWQTAEVLTQFMDIETDEIAEVQTFVRIVYDNEFVYIAAEMIQRPETIQATIYKRDRFQLRFEDYIQIGFDTFFSRKEAYLFLVSPLGTQWDARDSVFGRNDSWDAIWQSETRVLEDRWVAEIRIPIGVMHHTQADGQSWGLQFRRSQRDADIFSMWNYDPGAGVPRRGNGPKFIADFGNWVDLDLTESVVVSDIEYEAYVSSTFTKKKNGSDDDDLMFSTGLDASLRLTPNWVTTFTVNPDFGQVESDSDTIELRDTERFLPERRPFFNEGAELFRTPINIYNSRRILDIELGAKLTGAGKNWTAGVLNLQGESTRSGQANFMVGRYTQSLNEDIQLGAMMVHAQRRRGDYNFTGGPDLRWELSPTVTWTTQLLHMAAQNQEIEQDDGSIEKRNVNEHGYYTELSGGSKPLFWTLFYRDNSKHFEPDLGFIPRKDIKGPGVFLNYEEDVEGDVLEGYEARFGFTHFQNHAGRTVLRDYFVQGGVQLQNDFDFQFAHMDQFRDPYDNTINSLTMRYRRQARLQSWEVTLREGEFEDVPFEQVELEKPFGIGQRLTGEVEGTFRQEHPDDEDDDDIWLARVTTEYTFKWEGRVKLTIEESSEDRYNRTLLFAYEDIKSWDFFVVLNDIEADDEIVRGAFTKFVYRF